MLIHLHLHPIGPRQAGLCLQKPPGNQMGDFYLTGSFTGNGGVYFSPGMFRPGFLLNFLLLSLSFTLGVLSHEMSNLRGYEDVSASLERRNLQELCYESRVPSCCCGWMEDSKGEESDGTPCEGRR